MSNREKFLKKDDLSNLEFKHLKLMDTLYSKSTKKQSKTKKAIIERLSKLKIPVSKFSPKTAKYKNYELKNPLAKLLPDDMTDKINEERKIIEIKEYTDNFIRELFQNFTINESDYMERNYYAILIREDHENINSNEFFIKDYDYLIKYFKLDGHKLQNNKNYENKKFDIINNFIKNYIVKAYTIYANIIRNLNIIDDILYNTNAIATGSYIQQVFDYKNNLINSVKKFNKYLKKLKKFKIVLNISVINEINKKLDKINIKLKNGEKFSKRVSKSMRMGSSERKNKTRKSIFSRRIKSYS